jgi:hypothetical protein
MIEDTETGAPVAEEPAAEEAIRATQALDPPFTEAAAIGLANDFIVYANGAVVNIPGLSGSITLNEGESVYVYGKGTATSSTVAPLMEGMMIRCGNSEYVSSTRNHEGIFAYPSTGGALTVPVRFLFTAPTSGTYTCKLQAVVMGVNSSSLYLRFKAGVENTSISLSAPLSGAAKWGTEQDPKDNDYGDGGYYDDEAIHVGLGLPAGTAEYALRRRWQASASASSVDVIGDVELTSCSYADTTCAAYAWGSPSIANQGSIVDTRLIVQQMPSSNSNTPCAITYYPSSGYQRTFITSGAHHRKIFHRLAEVPFSPACGTSRSFINKVEVRWVANNPVRIERGVSTSGWSIGIAQNN